MSTEENKKVVLRWIEDGWHKKNWLNVIDELHAPDYVGHSSVPRDGSSGASPSSPGGRHPGVHHVARFEGLA